MFRHYVSLGWFCSVALELERIGLREASLPFDWIGTERMETVITLIEDRFEGFLTYEDLAQDASDRARYYDTRRDIPFYHDFDAYHPLADQLPGVRRRYARRIERFYRIIKEPTLFIRYLSGDEDLRWIEANQERILATLRSFHPGNDILYIADDTLKSDAVELYSVSADESDTVARHPFDKNERLRGRLCGCEFPEREKICGSIRKNSKEKTACARGH